MQAFALTLAGFAGLAGQVASAESPAERRHIQEHNTASSSSSSSQDWRGKINNVVVLVEENRSFDTFAGGLAYNATIDGLLRHNYCNALYALNASSSSDDPSHQAAAADVDICAGPLAADVAHDDPNHSIGGVNMQLFSTFHPNETAVRLAAGEAWAYQTMRGFVTEQSVSYDTLDKARAAEVINYYVSDTGRGKTDTRASYRLTK